MSAQITIPYLEKELSWLSFNERVLQEAADPENPVIERVRFLGIFSNNQDEFFRVRVADLRRRILIAEAKGGGQRSRTLMAEINSKVLALTTQFDEIYRQLLLDLARRNIFLVNETQLSDNQGNWLKRHFRDKIRRHIIPVLLTKDTRLDKCLEDGITYLTTEIRHNDTVQYAFIPVPSGKLPRFVQLPSEGGKTKKTLILLDNIIRHCLNELFEGIIEFDSLRCYSMKLTRDAEYDLSDEIELSLLEKMSSGLKQRLTAEPVRLVHDREMPETMLEVLRNALGIANFDSVTPGGRYHNFRDFMSFPNPGRKYLEHKKLPALSTRQFTDYKTGFEAISAGDVLLYYPYHKFSHLTEWLRQAAYDPAVRVIKINIYRVASKSQVINTLTDAVKNGKDVTVVVELRARFDEEANIEWARHLTDAGVKVSFGVPSLKIHSKLCLISRVEDGELVNYAHVGTGNFHEKTAKVYTDYALFTKHPEITREVETVFDFIEHPYRRVKFLHLLVSPVDSRRKLYSLIDREVQNKLAGQPCGITLKVNNLVDTGLIKKLYDASRNGVKVRLIIRGMCALLPGVPGVSDNIKAISVVDRFLEHPRVMVFENGGEPKVFITSADWMGRNIDNRIEVGCPIYAPRLKQQVLDMLNIQWQDTTKARVINRFQDNQYVSRGNRKKIRSQVAIYDYLVEAEQKPLAQ
ncbi:Polyphosphate kinase [Ferrimonas balearica DSM 9799]|uniref:Polyphosphate kinase n=1 Tax=Ferrimonas balearica (strain DSM 9799 / CCM 4581 / KCTC 23876 / PAT) TaxID=550540 RepID=E1SS63_FERBD|nr:polyphosphate kinase 1 [Ferrimonas balearica]ADN76995.1 Polyphosphate kinase [Ferrimonas balearica DSM 9799]